jgi:pyruvate,water dikinase
LASRRRHPAEVLATIRSRIVPWVMALDEEDIGRFLGGVIDGDGSFNQESSRLHIYVGQEDLLEAVLVACLRLGIVPQVTRNRTIYNVQIVEQVERLLGYTHRVQGEVRQHQYESRLLAAAPLFGDIVEEVNRGGKIRVRVNRNLLIGEKKIEQTLAWSNEQARQELKAMLDAPLRMYRPRQLTEPQVTTVYNFEVAADDELDKNYVAFSKMYTPLLISNSHAAVVARQFGTPAVVGCEAIVIDLDARQMEVNGKVVKESVQLKDFDTIELGSYKFQFYQKEVKAH